jgi:excisionase family DNA binding protein
MSDRVTAPDEWVAFARPSPSVSALKPLTVSVKAAKQITNLGRTKIYELIGDGTIESVKIGSKRLIVFASLERLTRPSKEFGASANPNSAGSARHTKQVLNSEDVTPSAS